MKITHQRSLADTHAARRAAYPPLEELADALYHAHKGDDSKIAAYLDKVEQVKLANPKPAASAAHVAARAKNQK